MFEPGLCREIEGCLGFHKDGAEASGTWSFDGLGLIASIVFDIVCKSKREPCSVPNLDATGARR